MCFILAKETLCIVCKVSSSCALDVITSYVINYFKIQIMFVKMLANIWWRVMCKQLIVNSLGQDIIFL